MAATTGEPVDGKSLFERWLATGGLYKDQEFSTPQAHQIAEVVLHEPGAEFGFDVYCTACQSRSHFKSEIGTRIRPIIRASPITSGNSFRENDAQYFARELGPALSALLFRCARSELHEMHFFLRSVVRDAPVRLVLTKIGQYPSLFDLVTPELERLGKLLDGQDRQELRSAELAASHGQHVAAFAYLRRVFERRVENAHVGARQDTAWDEAAYQKNFHRMDERIQALRAHLPPFLVEHRSAYGILSRGIHELSEDDCATGYAALHEAIHLILEQESERKARAEREKRLGATISKLGQQFSK